MPRFALTVRLLCFNAVMLVSLSASGAELHSPSRCIIWHDDYALAQKLARNQHKMLFVFFHSKGQDALRTDFEGRVESDLSLRSKLQASIALKLPLDARITVKGKRIKLLDHPAFAELQGRQGIAVIDFAHPKTAYYGYLVSALPFVRSKYYSFHPNHVNEVLDLPAGSLTQRTLIFAVRIHHEAPASTHGHFCQTLASEARSHSDYQASIGVQGHHHWDHRFHRISATLPGGLHAQEVVAESWPNESLLDAAVDCVASWRHSSGHWSAVRSYQPRYGYDMKRAPNGIWYATGLFGNHR